MAPPGLALPSGMAVQPWGPPMSRVVASAPPGPHAAGHPGAIAASSFECLRPVPAVLAGLAGFASLRRRGQRFRSAAAVLPDGTNEEGEDLAEPLVLGLKELKTMKVILYQQELSPPCVKIRTLLNYYGVPYRTIAGKHPTSDYKRIPVLQIGRFCQINDSHIIVKNLVPALTGQPFTPEELEMERRITFDFQPAFEAELANDKRDVVRVWSKATDFIGGWQLGLLTFVAPLIGFLVENLFRSRYPEMQLPSSKFGVTFRAAMKDQPFFHGELPGPIDLCLFGTYCAFADCNAAARFLSASDLQAWHGRMVDCTGGGDIELKKYTMGGPGSSWSILPTY